MLQESTEGMLVKTENASPFASPYHRYTMNPLIQTKASNCRSLRLVYQVLQVEDRRLAVGLIAYFAYQPVQEAIFEQWP